MKKVSYFITALSVLTLAYCKSTKPAQSTPTAAAPVATTAPAASAETKTDPDPNSPAAIQMRSAETRWPGTVEAELKEGQAIYTTKCVKCHKAYAIDEFSEKKWLHEIDDMSPKAKLTAEEKLKLTKYILSYRDTKEALKQK